MIAAIFTSIGVIAAVALYGLHAWREVRLAQASSNLDLAKIVRGEHSADSEKQRLVDALERAATLNERLAHKLGFGPKPRLEVDNDPTGGDAA